MIKRKRLVFVPAALALVTELPRAHPEHAAPDGLLPPPLPTLDAVIKATLKQYKKLELQLHKFGLRKLNALALGHIRGNILRTQLLPLLRHHRDLLGVFQPGLLIYKLLLSVVVAVLIKWWRQLLAQLQADGADAPVASLAIPPLDRLAYLELVLRIMALPYWGHVDPDFYDNYVLLLTDTMEWLVARLTTVKNVALLMAAFTGKVFAYAFFNVPHVAQALLFLLNVKQARLDQCRQLLPKLAPEYNQWPSHLHLLIDFSGVPVPEPRKKAAQFTNCVPPPLAPVQGIQDPQGAWVRRWGNCDSAVFMLFLAHYMAIVDPKQTPLDQCPGFVVVFGHIVNIIYISTNRIAHGAKQKPQAPNAVAPAFSVAKQVDLCFVAVIRLFKTIRDVLFSSAPGALLARGEVADSLVRYTDAALVAYARSVPVHDAKAGLVLLVVYEFVNHIVNNIPMALALISWEFWLSLAYVMLDKGHMVQNTLKTLAFLVNVWPAVPDALPRALCDYPWLADANELLKHNFALWLLSNDVYVRYMTHWLPAVRAFYMRLLVWRVIGLNNSQLLPQLLTTKRLQDKLHKLYNVVHDFAVHHQHLPLDFALGLPLVNRRLGIVPTKDDLDDLAGVPAPPTTSLRKTHPYEVFDDAIYLCLLLPLLELLLDELVDKPKLLVGLLGRFFRILAPEPARSRLLELLVLLSDRPKRNLVLLTLMLTAYLFKLRLLLPLLMLFALTPTLVTDLPTLLLDSDDETLEFGAGRRQPVEFGRLPPEIVRPMYKFEVVLDVGAMLAKMDTIHTRNGRSRFGTPELGVLAFPRCPRVPLLSVYFSGGGCQLKDEDNIDIDNFVEPDPGLERQKHQLWLEYAPYYQGAVASRSDPVLMRLVTLGRSLNEFNAIVDEFTQFLKTRTEIDQFNDLDCHEHTYLQKTIPFLPIDSFNELKLLNAN